MDMKISFPRGAKVAAEYQGQTIVTDQPPAAGGEGSAPSPFDLFLASLGTCAGWYVLSFCRGRDIPLDGISLVQRMERDAEKKLFTKITIEIALPPSFPDKYKQAVVRAAEQCAVKRHLSEPPAIVVTVGR